MRFLIYLIAYFLANYSLFFAKEVECQGAVLRVLNKTTNEKKYFTTPLSQTIELYNSSIVIHRCVKLENEGKNDEVALMTHKMKSKLNKEEIKLEIKSVEEKLKMMTSRIEILAFECMPDPQITLLFKTGYFEKEHRSSKVYVEEVNGKESLNIMFSKGFDSYDEAGIPFEEYVANPFFTIKGGDAKMHINLLKKRLEL